MDDKDKIKKLVFKYLDGLFENIEIINEHNSYIIGKINDVDLFRVNINRNAIYFSRDTHSLIHNMFNASGTDISDYIREYLSQKINPYILHYPYFPSI